MSVDRGLCSLLSGGAECGADCQPTPPQQCLADGRGCTECGVRSKDPVDVVAKERGIGGGASVACLQRLEEGRRGDRARDLGLCHGDVTEVGHPTEDLGASVLRGLGVASGVVGDGLLDRAGEGGCLDEGQRAGGLGEVAPRRRLDTVGAGTEIGDVEIALEDLVFAELAFEGERVAHLLQLAGHAACPGGGGLVGGGRTVDEHVLDVLLGEGGAALGDRTTSGIAHDGAQ